MIIHFPIICNTVILIQRSDSIRQCTLNGDYTVRTYINTKYKVFILLANKITFILDGKGTIFISIDNSVFKVYLTFFLTVFFLLSSTIYYCFLSFYISFSLLLSFTFYLLLYFSLSSFLSNLFFSSNLFLSLFRWLINCKCMNYKRVINNSFYMKLKSDANTNTIIREYMGNKHQFNYQHCFSYRHSKGWKMSETIVRLK